MEKIAPLLAVLVAGVLSALQAPTNASITRESGDAFWAGLISSLIGTAAVLAVLAVYRSRLTTGWTPAVPWWGWLGGLYGAVTIVAVAWATPKLGAGTGIVVVVAAQVGLGLVLDHFALLGLSPHPAGWLRIGGWAIMVAGALMVSRG